VGVGVDDGHGALLDLASPRSWTIPLSDMLVMFLPRRIDLVRITIDRERCMGSGNCAFWAPSTFDLDDDLKAIVLDADGDDSSKVRNAVEACPTHALALVEQDAS
jgi:ferredoxin